MVKKTHLYFQFQFIVLAGNSHRFVPSANFDRSYAFNKVLIVLVIVFGDFDCVSAVELKLISCVTHSFVILRNFVRHLSEMKKCRSKNFTSENFASELNRPIDCDPKFKQIKYQSTGYYVEITMMP